MQQLVKLVQTFLRVPVTVIENYEGAVCALKALRMSPELICVFMLASVVYTKQGPFAKMKGLDVGCPIQGFTIWWLMKNFIIPATRRGVVIPGLSAEAVAHGPSQSEAMDASATTKLAELTAVMESSGTPVPDLASFYYQAVEDVAEETDPPEDDEARDAEPGCLELI